MSHPIFHSLGSNYSSEFVTASLKNIFFPDSAAKEKLRSSLNQRFQGKSFLFYKGRDAIEFAFRAYGIGANATVLTQAFTCLAIEEAITRAGATPMFVDLEKEQLNPSVVTLEKALKKATNVRAVLIQHTLGYPADIQQIQQWCKKNNLLLIEDLAQSLGALDADGNEVGMYADVVICSFGRDKIIDTVAGGASIFKKAGFHIESISVDKKVPFPIILRDMLYPFFTSIIRNTHQIGVGKILFQVLKRLNLLTSPIESPTRKMAELPAQYAALALFQFKNLEAQLLHRRTIARKYSEELQKMNLPNVTVLFEFTSEKKLGQCVHQRFPIIVKDPGALSKELAKQQIYLSDRWYRKAVDFGSLKKKTEYEAGSCPNAEELAQYIFNLPTHQFISQDDTQKILQAIKKFEND
jgi:perosamine synthetase